MGILLLARHYPPEISGGGEWRALAEDHAPLTPLETALPILRKTMLAPTGAPFSADDAATELVAFLSSITARG